MRADTDEIELLVELVGAADGQGGFDVELVGEATADRDFEELSGQDLREGELLFGLPPRWWSCCWCSAACWRGWSRCCWRWCRSWSPWRWPHWSGRAALSLFVVNMITGMGLALGIDYALFILSRFREERAGGRPTVDAIGTAGATASRAVLFSGLAFVLAMGMVLVPDTILRSLAVGAILVGVVSVVAALTLLPALLGLLGDRVNALRLLIAGAAWPSRRCRGGRWSRVVQAGWSPGRSWACGVGRAAAGAGGMVLDLERGFCRASTLPDRFPSKQGLVALEASFPGATTEPAKVVVDGQVTTPQVRARSSGCAATWTAAAPSGRPRWRPTRRGSWRCWSVPVGADAESATAYAAVRQLRDILIPAASSGWRPRCWSPATPPRTSTTSPSSDAGSRWCWSSCSA